ncbi:MAG: hypothetical protein HOP27_14230 [Anaerolineales bacterium]|nr:hypothetical protein [Anaerolineales bacterium]
MFPRRGGFRPGRGAFPEIPPPALRRAQEFMAAGNYTQALQIFEQLAHRSEKNFPERTPFLFLQAGRAAILSGQTKIGVAHLRRGLTILASQGRFARMQAFGQRAVDELKARGLNVEAEEIASLLNGNTPKEKSTVQPASAKRPILPTHCPSCGAAVRPDDVEWLDDVTAECDYCGSPVR